MKITFILLYLLTCFTCSAQDVAKLEKAYNDLLHDEQFAHSILGFTIAETAGGKIIFNKNGETGLAPASCQKLLTSITAFELLGSGFHYTTSIAYDGNIEKGSLDGNIYVIGSGDPTTGSLRWTSTSAKLVPGRIVAALRKKQIGRFKQLIIDNNIFTGENIPDQWIWQDIGNYYGAGAWGFNWRENQYDVHFASGQTGNEATIVTTDPVYLQPMIQHNVTAGKKGSGDNVYIYAAPSSDRIFARGTVPPGQKDFVVAGAMPDPSLVFGKTMEDRLQAEHIIFDTIDHDGHVTGNKLTILDSILSPSFDSINYWFLKKSVNLFGEALIKTMAVQKGRSGSTTEGVDVIKKYWVTKGIDEGSLNIQDGSGLAVSNRITPGAFVQLLLYARNRPWFASFYNALPVIHSIHMKDGYIGGVRSYTGYIKNDAGKEYAFSFIVNNFTGDPGTVREKMWKVLDLLK